MKTKEVFNVVIYSNQITEEQQKQIEKLLQINESNLNGKFTAKCSKIIEPKELRKKLNEITNVSFGSINVSFNDI